jgi:Homeodomain-like domain
MIHSGMRNKQPQIVLQRKGCPILSVLLADGNTAQKVAKRARIVLMSADGHGVMAVIREAGVSKTTVWRWPRVLVGMLDPFVRSRLRVR